MGAGVNRIGEKAVKVADTSRVQLNANGDAITAGLGSLVVMEGTVSWGAPGQTMYLGGESGKGEAYVGVATRDVARLTGSGSCIGDTVRITGSVAPETRIECDNLILASGATHHFGSGNQIAVSGTLAAEGGGFVDFGRSLEDDPLPVPSSHVLMSYGTCETAFMGWKPLNTGHAEGKLSLRLVRDESGPVKVVRAELIYGGTLILLR